MRDMWIIAWKLMWGLLSSAEVYDTVFTFEQHSASCWNSVAYGNIAVPKQSNTSPKLTFEVPQTSVISL